MQTTQDRAFLRFLCALPQGRGHVRPTAGPFSVFFSASRRLGGEFLGFLRVGAPSSRQSSVPSRVALANLKTLTGAFLCFLRALPQGRGRVRPTTGPFSVFFSASRRLSGESLGLLRVGAPAAPEIGRA